MATITLGLDAGVNEIELAMGSAACGGAGSRFMDGRRTVSYFRTKLFVAKPIFVP